MAAGPSRLHGRCLVVQDEIRLEAGVLAGVLRTPSRRDRVATDQKAREQARLQKLKTRQSHASSCLTQEV